MKQQFKIILFKVIEKKTNVCTMIQSNSKMLIKLFIRIQIGMNPFQRVHNMNVKSRANLNVLFNVNIA